jgi:FKBP-type peptidyl-prolyl cis-trans isomerase SlyD
MTVTVRESWVITMEYTLRLADGEVADTSEGGEPLEFIHGQGQIIPGLEEAVLGMQVGEEKDIVVAPADGYGEAEPELKETLPRDIFPAEMEVGDAFRMRTDGGHTVVVYVESIDNEQVVVDLNHPLAGETLHFHVKIVGAREATDEDLAACAGCSCCGEHDGDCDCDDEEGGCDCGSGGCGCGHAH